MLPKHNIYELGTLPELEAFYTRLKAEMYTLPYVGCTIWGGGRWTDGKGYSKVSFKGKAHYVHRVFYEMTFGPVQHGLLLDHKCRFRPCCDPEHLEPVTMLVNTQRGGATLFRCTGA